MTQARDTLPLRLQLTAMQLPDNHPQPIAATNTAGVSAISATEDAQPRGCELAIYPGEPSEILVQLENLSSHPLSLNLEVEGNFPTQWCRLGVEGTQLPPGGKMEAVLYFQIEPGFFESSSLSPTAEALDLDYAGRIYIQYNRAISAPSDGEQQALTHSTTALFRLYVRPRSLYLNFLPDVYREVDFIGRLLKIFEEAFEPDVRAESMLWAHLNPRTAPIAWLPFLAHWVGWPLAPGLSIAKQRELIATAMELYRWRGTRKGLRQYLHLFTDLPLDEGLPEEDKHISIQEVGGRGFVLGEARIGRDAVVGGMQRYHFLVLLQGNRAHPLDERLIRKIIEQEKPAFCSYELYISEEFAE